jgi:acetyl-CoA carboxylase beta subunit
MAVMQAIAIMDFRFMGGSMGSVVGERSRVCFAAASVYYFVPLVGPEMQEGFWG